MTKKPPKNDDGYDFSGVPAPMIYDANGKPLVRSIGFRTPERRDG